MRGDHLQPWCFADIRGADRPTEASDVDAILHAHDAARRGIRRADELLRVVLLDDQLLTRQAMKALLLQNRRLQCVLDVGTIEECTVVATQQHVHLVIVNVDRHAGDDLDDIRTLVQHADGTRVLALGFREEPERLLAIYRAGASGYLVTSATVQDLHDAIEVAASGGTYVDGRTTKALASGLRNMAVDGSRNSALSRVAKLSDRERTVLRLVARGFSGPEVAEQLSITTKTVDTYRHRIFEKIGVHHRAEYVLLAHRAGILVGGDAGDSSSS